MDNKCVDAEISELPISTNCHGTNNPCIWSSPDGGGKVETGKQIFCNRSLNMKSIVAVGFDMDYTLAQYKPDTFESLAYEGTVKKLVYDLGYPQEVCSYTYIHSTTWCLNYTNAFHYVCNLLIKLNLSLFCCISLWERNLKIDYFFLQYYKVLLFTLSVLCY